GERDDFGPQAAGRQAQPLVPLRTEDERLAVLQVKLGLWGPFTRGEGIEDPVVIDDAVLQDLDHGGAGMAPGALQDLWHALLIRIDGARDQAAAGAQREAGGGDRLVERAARGGGAARPDPAGRRGLALRQAVDLVVEEQELQ